MSEVKSSRLLAIDILRGITIAGMILVNNPGSWSYVYAPLRHAEWNGLTPTDLVFPFFMFIMGISTYISLRKFNFEPSRPILWKIIKRTIVIFMIGIGLRWISIFISTFLDLGAEGITGFDRFWKSAINVEHLRILGVLQRLALSYCFASLIAIFVKHKNLPYLIAITLIGYMVLLLLGKGFEFSENNIISVIDQIILGKNHMYIDNGIYLDPEGLISTIPSIAHVLIGFCCGRILIDRKDNQDRIVRLFIVGAILTFVGFLLSYACPLNKKVWSPSFVLVTCGMASTLLALLIWLIDVKGYKRWSVFFESFGVNPLFVYVLAGILSMVFSITGVSGILYPICLQPVMGNYLGSLAYALVFIGIVWLFGHILYKKKIYIKI